jgi:(R)-2-hydroxyacyl-CoA dehydratese activating ATPase
MITAGVDIGSVGTKALVLDGNDIIGKALMPTGSRPKITAQMVLAKALAQAKLRPNDLTHVVSTGYGRRVVDFGEKTITEISACAQGMQYTENPNGKVRTIIDLGGQDIKVITLDDDGNTLDFMMNDKCAAGTGRFLEVIGRALEVDLEKLGELALQSKETIHINATCTVFAESEVISLLAQDVKKHDIISGVIDSIAERINAMAKKIGSRELVSFTGGGARNIGLVKSLEKKLETELYIPELPQFINSLGSALVAQRLG